MTRHLIRVLLGLLAVLALGFTVAACSDDDDEEESSSAQTQTQGGAATQPSDPSQLSAQDKAANRIRPVQGASSTSLTMGSKNFPEQFVLGEIYAQALQAAGYKVKKDLDLGAELVAYKSLREGEVDAYPEYTGTALTAFFDVKIEDVTKDPAQAYQQAKQAYAKQNITAFAPTPFENTYRIGLTKKKAQELGNPTKISDLAGKAGQLTINGFPECRQRIDCFLGVERFYNLDFKRFLPGENNYQLLRGGNTDLAFVFSTDGPLAGDQFVVLDDDKAIFPPYNVTLTMRDEIAQKLGPEGKAVVESVQKSLTEDVMQELNADVAVDKEEPAEAAKGYLESFGYVGRGS